MPEPNQMRGEDIPPHIVAAARRGYSMHGAGLVANILAAAWPEITRQAREDVAAAIEARRCPAHRLCEGCRCRDEDAALARGDTTMTAHHDAPDEPVPGTDDAIHAIRASMTEALLTERWGSEHPQIGEHRQHSYYAPCGICQGSVPAILDIATPALKPHLAEAEQRYRGIAEGLTAELRAAITAQGQAEATVQRVRDLHANEYGLCAACTNSHGVPWPCPTIAALDPKDTP